MGGQTGVWDRKAETGEGLVQCWVEIQKLQARVPGGLLCDPSQVTAPLWSHFPPLKTKWSREVG